MELPGAEARVDLRPLRRGLKSVCVRTILSPLRGWSRSHFHPGLAPRAAFLRCSAAWNQQLCSTVSLKSWFSRTHLKPRPFKARWKDRFFSKLLAARACPLCTAAKACAICQLWAACLKACPYTNLASSCLLPELQFEAL